MYRRIPVSWRAATTAILLAGLSAATLIPRMSFETLTDSSELVVSGRITRSWSAWDNEHKYIWTHYQLAVSSALKGAVARTVEFAEPGGQVDGTIQQIGGAVQYAPGDEAVIFLSRMPNRYLRTTGSVQGKYLLDPDGRLRAASALGSDIVSTGQPNNQLSLRTLEGMSLSELSQRIATRLRPAAGRAK
jgi:hypothetical protein